jgi:hypothetical protein
MIGHEEHRDIPQWLSWLLLVVLTGAIVSWCMFLMMMVMDAPREWDFGAFQDVPAQSVYSTRPSLPRLNSKIVPRFDPKQVPQQMPKLPEARRSPKLSETVAQPGGARP